MGNENTGAGAGARGGREREKAGLTWAVRYGKIGQIGEFTCSSGIPLIRGRKVVIATDRGIEIGEQVDFTCEGCPKSVSREQMQIYARSSGGDTYCFQAGRILREATESDLAELGHIEAGITEKIRRCEEFIRELELEMKIIECEHTFGGERIVFYFMSDHRIDFRELVRRLAHEFQTRIEMKQVGARDEARLLADYESCGRECCCKNFLKNLKPITMQMAKIQKATLDPSKVSGRCGRLKCCLRYEHDDYERLDRELPRIGARVATTAGTGYVIDRQILTQLLKVRTDEGKLVAVALDDVTDRNAPPPPVSGLPLAAETSGTKRSGDNGNGNNGRGAKTGLGERVLEEKPGPRQTPEGPGAASGPSEAETGVKDEEGKEESDSPSASSEGETGGSSRRSSRRRSRGRGRRRRRRPDGNSGNAGGQGGDS